MDALVVPGVGNFSQAAKSLIKFREQIHSYSQEGHYILGICLGMQIFLEESEEGNGRGLGLFKGKVARLPNTVKVPHMGWNTIEMKKQSQLFEGLPEKAYFYFVHSFVSQPEDETEIVATTTYGMEFAVAIAKDSILGLQFHPEKSGSNGTTVLSNFKEMIRR
jgi:glutamine amidotransferase